MYKLVKNRNKSGQRNQSGACFYDDTFELKNTQLGKCFHRIKFVHVFPAVYKCYSWNANVFQMVVIRVLPDNCLVAISSMYKFTY